MKRISLTLAVILSIFPTLAHAQSCVMRNDTPTTTIASDKGSSSCVAGDQYSRLQTILEGGSSATGPTSVLPISSASTLNGLGALAVGYTKVSNFTTTSAGTTTTINITGVGSTALVNDAVYFRSGVDNRAWSVVTAVTTNALTVSPALPVATGNGDTLTLYRAVPALGVNDPVNTNGIFSINANLDFSGQNSTATGILKQEDGAHTSGDSGVAVWGVRDDAGSTAYAGTDQDYTPLSLSRWGWLRTVLAYDSGLGSTNQVAHREDDAAVSADAGVGVLAVRNDTWSATTNTDGDYTAIAVSSAGTVHANVGLSGQASTADGLLKSSATTSWGSGDAGVGALYYREAALSTTGVGASDGKYSNGKTDTTGALWQRPAPNQDVSASLVTCSGCTTTQTGADQINYSGKCATVVLDMTTVGTGSVTLEIDGKDVVSGKYFPLLTGAAVVTNSTNVYQLCPGVTVAANAAVSAALPRTWRVKVTANNANATTYTVGASIIE